MQYDPDDDDDDTPIDEEQLEVDEWQKLYPEEFPGSSLSDEEIATFADIRMRMMELYGPYLWRDLLIAIVDDHLDAACADAAAVAPWQMEPPGWLLRQQLETAPLRGVRKETV